jgi:hypothetical protein
MVAIACAISAAVTIIVVLMLYYGAIDGYAKVPLPLAGQESYVLTGASGGGWQVYTPPGTVINYAGSTAPTGYLVCNGSLISRATYADLFTAIGTLYGAGDGATTFAVPDLRGQFIRGLDSGANVDAGRVLGSVQADSLQQHGHVLYRGDGGGYEGPQVRTDDDNGVGGLIKVNGGFGLTYIREIFPGDVGGSIARISGETRPKNVAMIMCIKT